MAEDKVLSEREQQILRLVATGASNKEIAHRLVISTNTVKVHLRNIFAKISVMSRTEATLYAIREGLVQVGEARPDAAVAREAEELAVVSEPAAAAPESERIALSWWRRLGPRRLAGALALVAVPITAGATAGVQALGPLIAPPTPLPQPPAITPSALATALSRWRAGAPMPTSRAGLALAAQDGLVYAIAGQALDGPTGASERYDPNTDAWTPLAPKPVPVADVGAAVVGGRIYVPGGRLASGAVTSTMEVYTPASDGWERRASLPVPLSAYALVAFEGRLYLFGGWDGTAFVASTYEYDPARDAWTSGPPMPTARGLAGAAVAGGKVYVLGGTGDGQTALAANEEFTPGQTGAAASPWATRAPVPGDPVGCGVASVLDGVHVFSGGGGIRGVRVYSHRTDSWSPSDQPPSGVTPTAGCAATAVATHIYLVGGRPEFDAEPTMEYQAAYLILLPAATVQ